MKPALIFGAIFLLAVLWSSFAIGRVFLSGAPWGPAIDGRLPNGTEVNFQARPGRL